MKKFIALFVLIVIPACSAFADGFGGFKDNNVAKKTTVTEALKMNDDSYVTVKGNIVKKISDDRYMFKDSTGSMTVEIDNDRWAGISADTKDILELTGEIEKKNNYTRLDVDSIRKANK